MRKMISIFMLWIMLTISLTSIFLTETSLADSDEVLIYDEDPEDNSVNVSISISTISVLIQHLDGKTFNWTITTLPDIGSSSGINEHDGVKNCTIDNLSYSTLYIWNVTVYDNVNWTNQSFCFTTSSVSNRPPYTPRNPFPTNSSTNVSVFVSLSWSGGDPDGDNVTYDVYFGTTDSPPMVVNNQSNLSYHPPEKLSNNTFYYWRIIAWDTHGASRVGPLWNFMTYHSNEPPNIPGNPAPTNGATGSSVNADLSWTGGDPNLGDTIKYDVYFDMFSPPTTKISANHSEVWYDPGGLEYNKVYYWQIVAWDNLNASATGPIWHFTTEPSPPPLPSLKWSYVIAASGTSAVGPVVADVTNNGWMEVVRSGRDGIVVYNGSTGGVVWQMLRDMGDYHLPVEIIDLNKDGIPEIITKNGTGTMAIHGNNGTVYWSNPNAPLYDKHPVAGDIDADGYPEVFVASMGKITALSHDGQIFATTYTYWPCWGGLSLGDTNQDGVFELYLNERSYYYQNNYKGQGVRAFWASNLTNIWNRPEMLSSSHCPTLVDVNGDGVLDVVSLHQGTGLGVFNSADGSVIRQALSISGFRTHSQPTIHDIDGDGNLELMTCREWSQVRVLDLHKWVSGQSVDESTDAILSIHGVPILCWEPPAVADVTGDGFVEILASTEFNISIFNRHYQFIGSIPLTNPGYYGMSMIVAQDIDNDGKLELVVNRRKGMYVYDTEGVAPTPRALSQFNYYSQHRGRSPYYQEYGPPAPVVKDEGPVNGSVGQVLNPVLSVFVYDYQGDLMNVTFSTNASTNEWHTIKNIYNVHEGTYTANTTEMNAFNTTYWWKVTATDSTGKVTSKLYKFTTKAE